MIKITKKYYALWNSGYKLYTSAYAHLIIEQTILLINVKSYQGMCEIFFLNITGIFLITTVTLIQI